MNLAEFPIAALSNRTDPGAKTIVFKDRTFDKKTGQIVDRQLTVTASDKYGLPASLDDEVILGLLQLSRLNRYQSPQVHFTRYQLLRILGWADTTKNYRRLEEALYRWVGVTLYYENAWRDRSSGDWRSTSFHLLDIVEIFKPGSRGALAQEGYCFFKWSDVVFKSLCDGNLKTLDFQTYRALETPVAKRMFRFLDKRFYQRSKVSFDVERFAYEKLGLSRSYKDISQIKRCLLPGILELERIKFIITAPQSKRFTKTGPGVWEVHFEKYQNQPATAAAPASLMQQGPESLEERLQSFGVSKRQSKLLAAKYPPELIVTKMEALEFLLKQDGTAKPRNQGGYLAESIRNDYVVPAGFKTKAGLAQEQAEQESKIFAKEEAKRQRVALQKQKWAEEQNVYEQSNRIVQAYLDSLNDHERGVLEQKALQASSIGGHMSKSVRESVIWNHTFSLIEKIQGGGQQEMKIG